MAGSRVGLFDNLNIPIHRDAQHREDYSLPGLERGGNALRNARFRVGFLYQVPRALKLQIQHRSRPWRVLPASFSPT
jgi:hypothetical protein